MSPPRFKTHILLFALLALAACGTQAPAETPVVTEEPTASLPPTSTPDPTPTPTEIPSLAVTSLQDVRLATVQIQATGTFMDPSFPGIQTFAGSGSGFIISEDGLAVTNNHVVTGAAILQVWLDGEDEPRNARILGVSECSDLAVIDIEGEGFNYLEWYDGPITVGNDIYAAGFPFGDPEFTLTRGIVSKEHADGDSYWASVEFVIEHDASINPGNSGGPLVTPDGTVMGINFAAYKEADQSFAISREEALKVIDVLSAGDDLDSMGVNGIAIDDGQGLTGIWVASVRSGSPADNAGLLPGDILVKLEGMSLAQNGTMADYCNILRTHQPDDTLTIEVVRLETEELLKGQFNGIRLEVIESLAEQADLPGLDQGDGYMLVEDQNGIMEVEVPVEWSDVSSGLWTVDGEPIGTYLWASSDLDRFFETSGVPAIFFGATSDFNAFGGHIQVLDRFGADFMDACEYAGRWDYDDGYYSGHVDRFDNCGGPEITVIHIAATPIDDPDSLLVFVSVTIVDEAGWDHVDRIVETFFVMEDPQIVLSD